MCWSMFIVCGPAQFTLKRSSTESRPCSPSMDRNTPKKQSENPMNLAETLLQKLSEWRPAEEGRPSANFPLPEHGWTIRLDAERVDTVGCVLNEVAGVRDNPLPDDPARLEAHARQAASHTTGLLEPLRLVEV